ncbi:hypothetical protein ACFWNT_31880 [Streptomyces sp. NPDC058409]|uniref:hypothetical protein n=1 Tax=Streptomyces sp. NPDC058409 TaxID=3346484 RepID=UPI003656EE25
MTKYRVYLQAYASAVVDVEADDYLGACRKAQEAVKDGKAKRRPVKNWSPTMVANLDK